MTDQDTPVWRAFYVKPRHERKAKDRLEAAGLTVFCPLVKTKVRWSDRWKKVQKPALPGYLFAHVSEPGRRTALQDPSVLNCVFWNKKAVSISDEEILAIRILLDQADEVSIQPLQPPKPGDTVHLNRGPFAGHDLIVLDANRTHARLELPAMGCVLTAKLSHLTPVSG